MITGNGRSGTAVEVVGAGKTFRDGTRALAPVDLSVEPGETLVLLGPSGCGKTTLLRLIAGLETPDQGGRILFGGKDVTTLPIERREVGMVFQSYALFPNMNVLDNVAYGLRIRGVRRAKRHEEARRYLDLCRIGELEARSIAELSGGQRQRVALARAIIVKPRVLLLDEPLTALDANLREALRIEINTLLRSLSITAIYVTHDQAEAMMLGDRIAVLDKGRIAQVGTPHEIYTAPHTPFVARFVGVSNAISGHATSGAFRCPHGTLGGLDLPDGPCTIHFRPEAAELGAPGAGSLDLEVLNVDYLGSSNLVTLKAGAGELRAVIPARQRPAAGETVGLTLAPDAIITFRDLTAE